MPIKLKQIHKNLLRFDLRENLLKIPIKLEKIKVKHLCKCHMYKPLIVSIL